MMLSRLVSVYGCMLEAISQLIQIYCECVVSDGFLYNWMCCDCRWNEVLICTDDTSIGEFDLHK